jgi:hypothetical protein
MKYTEEDSTESAGARFTPGSTAQDLTGLVNKQQVARAASVSMRSVDNLIAQRKIPVIRLSPRCIRFHLPSVLAALRKFEIKEVRRERAT